MSIPPGKPLCRQSPAQPAHSDAMRSAVLPLPIIAILLISGCGTTQQRTGTEQLLLSDSVDRSVDKLEFGVLSGRKIYLDTTYIRAVKGIAFVNSDYIISALRQKLMM